MPWQTGERKILYESRLFDIYAVKIDAKRRTRFNSQIDQFRVGITLKQGEEDKLLVTDYNLAVLRPVLHKIYKEVLSTYIDKNGLIMQMNLGLAQLKKAWLKTGTFDPSKLSNEAFCDWLINLLEVCVHSDDQLTLQGLQIDVIVTHEGNHTVGCQNMIMFNYMSQNCRSIARQASDNLQFQNLNFVKKLKFGLVDLTELDHNFTEGKCLELSLAFATLCEEKLHNVIEALKTLIYKYECSPSFLLAESIVSSSKSNKTDFFASIEHYSKLLGRHIFVMCINNAGAMEIFYKTDIENAVPHNLPIYLLHTDPSFDDNKNVASHCTYIFEVNPNRTHMKFCKICQKSFAKISRFSLHKCIIARCKGCLNYYSQNNETISINGKAACLSNYVKNIFKNCNLCGRLFTNLNCYEKHLKEKKLACDTYRRCVKCKNMFYNKRGHIHECYEKFCISCLSYHKQDQKECYVKNIEQFSPKLDKIKPINFALHLSWSEDLLPILCLCSPVSDDPKRDSNIVYAKSAFNDSIVTMNRLDENKYDFINNYAKGTYTFDYVVYSLLHFIERYSAPQNVAFITTNSCFEFICKNMVGVNASFHYHGESPASIKINNSVIKKLSSYFDNSKNSLALELGTVNCAIDVMPYRLKNCSQLDKNKCTELDIYEFPVENMFGSTYKEYKKLLQDRDNLGTIYGTENQDRVLHFKILINQHMLLVKCTLKLQSVFSSLLTGVVAIATNGSDSTNTIGQALPSIFSYKSSTSAIFNMFLMVIPKKSLPILSSNVKSQARLVGVSKAEVVVSKFFYQLHKTKCNTENIMSYISGDRSQFTTVQNLSCDFYCSQCKLAIFVQGQYKSSCKFHKNGRPHQFFGVSSQDMISRSTVKLRDFKRFAGKRVSRIIEIDECCVYSRDTWQKGQNSIAMEVMKYGNYSPADLETLQSSFRTMLSDYIIEDNLPLDYQKSVQSQIVESVQVMCNSDENCAIQRFDLSSAYVRCLENPTITFPMSSPLNIMHDASGQSFVNDNILNNSSGNYPYCVIRARVFTNKVREVFRSMPYFSYSNTQGKTSLTLCRMCSDTMHAESCAHTPYQQSFIVTCMSEDLRYAHELGYYFCVLEVHHWSKQAHYVGLSNLATLFLKTKDTKDKFISKIVKKWILAGIGRWALNYTDFGSWKKLQNFVHLISLYKNKYLKMYDIYSDNVCYALLKDRHFSDQKKNYRSNVCPIVLSSICSAVKRKIHNDCVKVTLSNTLSLLRIDADCITVKVLLTQESQSECNAIFSPNTDYLRYKPECEKINRLMCFKKRSYSITYDKYSILKSCGFSASLQTRFSEIDFNHLYRNIMHTINTDPMALIKNHMRIPKVTFCQTTGVLVCITVPFGYVFGP